MHSAIIIDDQKMVVDGMVRLVEKAGVTVIATALNGDDGFEKIKKHKPDLVITDIQMCGKDGLELISASIDAGIKSKFIIMSSYSKFEYAKKALEYGVEEYLLKPVLSEDIIKTIEKVIKKIDSETKTYEMQQLYNNMLSSMQAAFVDALLQGKITSCDEIRKRAKYLEISLPETSCVIMVQLDEEKAGDENENDAKLTLLSELSVILGCEKMYKYFDTNKATFICPESCHEPPFRKELEKIIEDFKEKYLMGITFGIGTVAKSPSEIHKSAKTAAEVLKYTYFFGSGEVLYFEDIVFSQISSPDISFFDTAKILDAVKMRSQSDVRAELDGFVKNISGNIQLSKEYVKNMFHVFTDTVVMGVYYIGEKLPPTVGNSEEIWLKIENCRRVDETLEAVNFIISEIFKSIHEHQSSRNMRIAEQVKQHIEKHFAEDIAIEDLSKIIYLTPNYIGKAFSEATGMTVNEYLHSCRIQRALQLLHEPGSNVSSAAYAVGYKRATYFAKKFKEQVGITPSEYINNIASGGSNDNNC